MKKHFKLSLSAWKRLGFAAFAVLSSAALLLIKLPSLAPSLSPLEKSTLVASGDWHNILLNPLNLPLKSLQWLIHFAPAGHATMLDRLPSVALAAIALLIFIYILQRWYGTRITVLGFCVLVSSAWFLHVSRFAGTNIEYLSAMLGLLAVHIGLHDHKRPVMTFVWLLANLLLLFVPGFVWLVTLNVIWQRADLSDAWRGLKSWWRRVIWVIIALGGLAAPLFVIIRSPHLLMPFLGLPAHFARWQTLLKQLLDTCQAFFYHGPHNPQLWLGHLPLLDAFLILMLVAGGIFYAQHWRAARTRLLLSYLVLGVILVSLGGPIRLSVIVPIVFLVIAAGIAYILHFWLSVFPRNPLARTVGIAIIAVVIALSCLYNIEQYFVAWPHNTETIKIYRQSS